MSETKNQPQLDKLNGVLMQLKQMFVGKDDIIDLLGICLVGGENLFMLGPPGTAKSALVYELGRLIEGRTFQYLLTRFTEPNELFGPFDIRRLREGELVTNTSGMLPEASLVFLDELLNANSAILNSLLLVLNERVFRRGSETRKLPMLTAVGASNRLPEDEALQALFDRFLIRVHCDNVEPDRLHDVLDAGWALEQEHDATTGITTDDIREIQRMVVGIDLSPVRTAYIDLVHRLRNAGIPVSDRRAVKLQRLIAASALICGRSSAVGSDMWMLRYIWDTEEQQEIIAGIVDQSIGQEPQQEHEHPRARENAVPNADELAREIEGVVTRWQSGEAGSAELAVLRDRLRYLSGRSQWVKNPEQQEFLKQRLDEAWQMMADENV